MTTTLYLVRHGETVDNAAHIMQGQTPGELNDKGIAQAEEVAARMADHPIDVFVSSDLKRSIQTCEIIAQRLARRYRVDRKHEVEGSKLHHLASCHLSRQDHSCRRSWHHQQSPAECLLPPPDERD